MKQGITKSVVQSISIGVGVIALLAIFSQVNAAEQPTQPRPDAEDFGFTRYIQHYPMGSKTVLVFQSDSVFGKSRFGVAADFVDENIEMLNKFLKWSAMAQERGDVLDKEIGLVKGFDFGMYYYWNRYSFVTNKSAFGTDYVLSIQPGNKMLGFKFTPKSVDDTGQAGGPIDFKMYFNEDQVRLMIARMQEFKDGKLKTKQETENNYQ